MQRTATMADVLAELARMAAFLEEAARSFPGEAVRRPPAEGGFCFVEQVWHLADLEGEGYSERLARLRREDSPLLADFDGARAAREREYLRRSVAEGLAAFAAARRSNLAALESVSEAEWRRGGTQEGVGPITLRDVPFMMAEHDAGHREEIRGLLEEVRGGATGRPGH